MKQHGLVALIFVIGCATGGVASQLVVPPARAGTTPARWEYLCARVGAGSVTESLNTMGEQGWELASMVPADLDTRFGTSNAESFSVCAKRALP